MRYKNLNTAAAAELGRIAGVQHHAWGIRNPSKQKRHPLDFDQWFLKGVRKMEKKGLEFEFLSSGLVRIIRGKELPNLLRTVSDFEKEYQEEYLSDFY
jgi:hypothetical protein